MFWWEQPLCASREEFCFAEVLYNYKTLFFSFRNRRRQVGTRVEVRFLGRTCVCYGAASSDIISWRLNIVRAFTLSNHRHQKVVRPSASGQNNHHDNGDQVKARVANLREPNEVCMRQFCGSHVGEDADVCNGACGLSSFGGSNCLHLQGWSWLCIAFLCFIQDTGHEYVFKFDRIYYKNKLCTIT